MDPLSSNFAGMLSHVIPFTLVMFRLAGTFIAAPLLSSTSTPVKFKALMVAMTSAAVYPLIGSRVTPPQGIDVFLLVPLVLCESLIGFVIGAVASVPVLTLEMSGVIAGQQMGFGLARIYNPEADFETDVLGQLLYYIAAGAYLSMGGVEALLGCVLDSFGRIPVGAFVGAGAPVDALVGALTSGFELAIRVAAPVTGVVLLLAILLGVIGKTMPQINIMTVGFTLKILAGLSAIMFAVNAIRAAAGDEAGDVTKGVIRWVESFGVQDGGGHG